MPAIVAELQRTMAQEGMATHEVVLDEPTVGDDKGRAVEGAEDAVVGLAAVE